MDRSSKRDRSNSGTPEANEDNRQRKITDFSAPLSAVTELKGMADDSEFKGMAEDSEASPGQEDILSILKDIQTKVACLPHLQQDITLLKSEVESLKSAQNYTDGETK